MSDHMADNVDDIFVSLGGSLMRDLLADLQSGGEEETWSLEQLEKELAHLEQPTTAAAAFAAPSAASLVVSHAQERAVAAAVAPSSYLSPPPASAGDAWSSSLERFTAMSLEQDFLAADSARKQSTTTTTTSSFPLADFSQAEDYNISELATLSPPPGLMASTIKTPSTMVSPQPSPFGRTDTAPPASIPLQDIAEDEDANHNQEVEDQVAALRALLHIQQPKGPPPPPSTLGIPRPPPPTPQNSIGMYMGQPVMSDGMSPIPQGPNIVMPPTPHQHQQQHQQQHGPPGVMPVVVPAGGIPIAAAGMPPSAWQTPPKAQQYTGPPIMAQPQPPPPMLPRVYCASHPAARPIPATALESKLMNARDIAYVVHSILKPLLLLGISESDYDIQYLRRCGDSSSSSATPNKPTDAQQQEVQSRLVKAKDWSTKHSILGHVAKTNVTRPRALIATPTATEQVENSEQRDRANLWKARIYVDQGYQAYLGLSGAWMASRTGGGGNAPIQLHLKKLLKCFGTTPPANPTSDYTVVEPAALELLVKLDKGKILVARVIEQALLPPAAVLALLPHLFHALLASTLSTSTVMMDVADDRVFRSLGFCIQTLPQVSPDALMASLQQVLQTTTDHPAALSSMARMECVHTLLLRGSNVAQNQQETSFAPEWSRLEGELMAILGG